MNLAYINPIDPYPTDPGGNALTMESGFILANQCLLSPQGCSVSMPNGVIRDPVTGEVLTASSAGGQYPGGVNLQTLLLIAAAGVILYLLLKEK